MKIKGKNKMMCAFRHIEPCIPEGARPEKESRDFGEWAQITHASFEIREMEDAYRAWRGACVTGASKAECRKAEVEYLEEIADAMTALATLLWAHTGGDGEQVGHVIKMVNLKNELRGYHEHEEDKK